MLYIIPGWDELNNVSRGAGAKAGAAGRTRPDADAGRIRLLSRGNREIKLILPGFAPQLRRFLHRQGLTRVPCWSCFDALQEMTRTQPAVFSFRDLAWPAHTEFVYTPFVVAALSGGEKYAEVIFGEDGNLSEVLLFEGGAAVRRNIYDDRGFLSATQILEHGAPAYTDYLTEGGFTKLRVFADTGRAQISPSLRTYLIPAAGRTEKREFRKLEYGSLDEVTAEVMEAFLAETSPEDLFCANETALCRAGLARLPEGRKHIITGLADSPDADIAPYIPQMRPGGSRQLAVQSILVPADDLPAEELAPMTAALASYLTANENAEVHLLTANRAPGLPARMLEAVAQILEDNGFDRRLAEPQEQGEGTAENEVDEEKTPAPAQRFFADLCPDEASLIKCVRGQRIMVDMQGVEDPFLQLCCVHAAVPMLVRRESEYAVEGGNAAVIPDYGRLPALLGSFLGSQNNWNRAEACAYEMSRNYTAEKILEKWESVLEEAENQAGAPAGAAEGSRPASGRAVTRAASTPLRSRKPEKPRWLIKWNEYCSQTYLYGSVTEYLEKGAVRFENPLMPPGTVIKTWYSKTSYQAMRIEPALPVIPEGGRCSIHADIDADGGFLLRLVFLDRFDAETGEYICRGGEGAFTCPPETYSYKMELINGGMTRFVFRGIVIEEASADAQTAAPADGKEKT